MLAGVVLPVGAAESARPASGTMTAMETVSTDRLRHHVEVLAGEIGERNVWRPQALARAADYIRDVWNRQGYRVHIQEYDVQGVTSANLEIAIPGGDLASQILLLGAHYDSVQGSPGANDNGTGVAALLELSRCLADRRPRRYDPFRRLHQRGTAAVLDARHGQRGLRARRTRAWRRHPRHAFARNPRLLQRRARQPALPAVPRLVLSGPRRFHRFRVQREFARPARTNRGGVPRRERFSGGTHRRPGVGPGRGLERPAFVLAGRLPRRHGHRHRALSLSVVPHGPGHAGQTRLRPPDRASPRPVRRHRGARRHGGARRMSGRHAPWPQPPAPVTKQRSVPERRRAAATRTSSSVRAGNTGNPPSSRTSRPAAGATRRRGALPPAWGPPPPALTHLQPLFLERYFEDYFSGWFRQGPPTPPPLEGCALAAFARRQRMKRLSNLATIALLAATVSGCGPLRRPAGARRGRRPDGRHHGGLGGGALLSRALSPRRTTRARVRCGVRCAARRTERSAADARATEGALGAVLARFRRALLRPAPGNTRTEPTATHRVRARVRAAARRRAAARSALCRLPRAVRARLGLHAFERHHRRRLRPAAATARRGRARQSARGDSAARGGRGQRRRDRTRDRTAARWREETYRRQHELRRAGGRAGARRATARRRDLIRTRLAQCRRHPAGHHRRRSPSGVSPVAPGAAIHLDHGLAVGGGREHVHGAQPRALRAALRLPAHLLTINYFGVPLSGQVTPLAIDNYLAMRPDGPNDGLTLIADALVPDSPSLAVLGRDHFSPRTRRSA